MKQGPRRSALGVPSQRVPSGPVSVVESLGPGLGRRPAEQAAAGSQIPEPHGELRGRSPGVRQLAVVAEFSSTLPAL